MLSQCDYRDICTSNCNLLAEILAGIRNNYEGPAFASKAILRKKKLLVVAVRQGRIQGGRGLLGPKLNHTITSIVRNDHHITSICKAHSTPSFMCWHLAPFWNMPPRSRENMPPLSRRPPPNENPRSALAVRHLHLHFPRITHTFWKKNLIIPLSENKMNE